MSHTRLIYSVRYIIGGLFFLYTIQGAAQTGKYFQFNKTCQRAYYAIMALKFEEGNKYLNIEKSEHPGNLIIPFLESKIDFLKVITNEDKRDMKAFSDNIDRRLAELKEGPESSPYYLYCQGEMNIQYAICKFKFEDYMSGAWVLKRGYGQLTDNDKDFPAFVSNKKSLAFLHAAIGTLPDSYKWLATLLGFHGSIAQGMKEIEEARDSTKKTPLIFDDEIRIVYAIMATFFNSDINATWSALNEPGFEPNGNLLDCFFKAYFAMKFGRNDEVIDIIQHKPNTGYNFYYLEYMQGLAKLQRLDSDACSYIQAYTAGYMGHNYIKDAYMRLAWCYWLKGDKVQYHKALSNCHTHGALFTDGDKYADNYAKQDREPNTLLLKAHVLADGMYTNRALAVLNTVTENTFGNTIDKTEYNYRCGRIYYDTGNIDKAIPYLKRCIDIGQSLPEYFAANAALYLGQVYEQQHNNSQAVGYYKMCIGMPNTEYKNGLVQKAKAGINRLNHS